MNLALKIPIMITAILLYCAPLLAQETVVLTTQDPVSVSHVDIGEGGASHGDMFAIDSPFVSENGETGTMSGLVIIVDLPDSEQEPIYERIGLGVIHFGGPDTLSVSGRSLYARAPAEMENDVAQVRAVIGGTGRFIGARGQMTTSRLETGHYEHVIQLID